MKSFGNGRLRLPLAALAATLAFGASQASAQGFLEMLLGGGAPRQAPLRGNFPPPPKPRKAPVATTKISAPTFAIRKPAVAVFTLDDYVAARIMSDAQAAALRQAVASRANILVAGGTSTA